MDPNMMPQAQNILPNQQTSPLGITPQHGTNASACMSLILFLVILLIFFLFGDNIFKFFHIEHVYRFIVSIMIIIFLYGIGLFVSSYFIKYPQDILTLVLDRLRNQ